MDWNKILNNRRNQIIIGGVVLLGVGYYLWKKGKLPFLNKLIGGKKYKVSKMSKELTLYDKKIPNGRSIFLETPANYKEITKSIDPNNKGIYDLIDKNDGVVKNYKKADRVILRGTNIDGNYQIVYMTITGENPNNWVLKDFGIIADKEPVITNNNATVEFVKSKDNPDYPLDKLEERNKLRTGFN